MNIPDRHIAAIKDLGYTSDEARFLFIVATYSGYFVPRQFISFTGARWGKRSNHFTEKLESRGHATWREYQRIGVYHLCSRTLYRRIEREDLRNRRRHSTQFIRTRLLILDFVLANQSHQYLEKEEHKIHFFTQLGIPIHALPAKTYEDGNRSIPAVRYFVDSFPIFLDSSGTLGSSIPTFTYVDAGLAGLAGFTNYLRAHIPLFRQLRTFRFLYLSDSTVHFIRAAERFSRLVKPSVQEENPFTLENYFQLRRRWEAREFESLTHQDLESLNEGQTHFGTPSLSALYERWRAGQLAEDDLGLEMTPSSSLQARFETQLISASIQNKLGSGMAQVTRTSPPHFTGSFSPPACKEGQDE